MAESHVVTGLVAKWGQSAGRIEQCRRELERLVADVGHLDGSIKLFAPDYTSFRVSVQRSRANPISFSAMERIPLPVECRVDAVV